MAYKIRGTDFDLKWSTLADIFIKRTLADVARKYIIF